MKKKSLLQQLAENERVFLEAGANCGELRLQFDAACRLLNRCLLFFSVSLHGGLQDDVIGFLKRNNRLEVKK